MRAGAEARPAPMPTAERALLHRGGRPGGWGSLGLWADGVDDYAGACEALARAVGQAAGIGPGCRVLSLASGAGDELLLWAQHFGAAQVLGLERDAALVDAARQRLARAGLGGRSGDRVEVRVADLRQLAALGLPAGGFDAVVCVDAAYWLGPRDALWRAIAPLLAPGGRVALTDLSLQATAPSPVLRALLRAAARLAGVPLAELRPPAAQAAGLTAAGFGGVRWLALDATVLDGFAAFVRDQGPRVSRTALHPDWRRPALTARLVAPCRAAGLGYGLLSGTRSGAAGTTRNP